MTNLWRNVYTKKQENRLLNNVLVEIDKIRKSGALKGLIEEVIEIEIEDKMYMEGSIPTGLYFNRYGCLCRLVRYGDGECSDYEWRYVTAKTKEEEKEYLKEFVVSPQDIINLQKKL